jgi:hypothetical protein
VGEIALTERYHQGETARVDHPAFGTRVVASVGGGLDGAKESREPLVVGVQEGAVFRVRIVLYAQD